MKLYKEEKGLQISASFTAALKSSEVDSPADPESLNRLMETVPETKSVLAAESNDQSNPLLAFGAGVLASTSMNGNDDIFLPDEVWAARKTPFFTHIDIEHKKKKIIGHTYDVYITDPDGNNRIDVLAKKAKQPKGSFDISIAFALYKSVFPKTINKIKKLHAKKKAFLSMEGLIADFDYGIVSGSGTNQKIEVIKRNDETAFLTKYLRAAQGEGKYKGKKIGRVLRNLAFTGAGWVKVPANPTSFITDLRAGENQESDYSFEIVEDPEVLAGKGLRKTYYILPNRIFSTD